MLMNREKPKRRGGGGGGIGGCTMCQVIRGMESWRRWKSHILTPQMAGDTGCEELPKH